VFVRAVDSAGNERSTSVIFVVDECRNRIDGTTSCNYVESLKPEPEPVIVEPSMTDPPYILVWILSGIFVFSLIVMSMVISTSMSGPKKKKAGSEEEEDEDWMSEFIGTSQDLDMGAVTDTSAKTDEKSVEPEAETEAEPEEDPFAVNVITRKTRRKKDVPEVVEDDDDDDDGIDWSEYDDDEEEEAVEEKPVSKKRAVGRRAAPRKAPKRRAVGRKKSED